MRDFNVETLSEIETKRLLIECLSALCTDDIIEAMRDALNGDTLLEIATEIAEAE